MKMKTIDRSKLDISKIKKNLHSIEDLFTERYGAIGTPERKEFHQKAKAWYFSELLKEERKKQKITQKELAERVGKSREHIALLEKGETDMQLSTFLGIAEALGLKFGLVYT